MMNEAGGDERTQDCAHVFRENCQFVEPQLDQLYPRGNLDSEGTWETFTVVQLG